MARLKIRKRQGSADIGDVTIRQPNGSVLELENVDGSDGIPVTIEPDGTITESATDDQGHGNGTDGNGPHFVDASDGGTSSDTGTRRTRRTRSDAGTRRGRRTTTRTTDNIASLLFTIHFGIGRILRTEALQITKEEAQRLGVAVTDVANLYDIPVISDKALAWTNLAIAMGDVYGTRLMAVGMKKKEDKRGNVTVIRPTYTEPAQGDAHQPSA